MARKTGKSGWAGTMPRIARIVWLVAALAVAAPATGATIPFTEDFSAGAAGWVNGTSGPLDFHASGGPGGGSYVSTTAAAINDPGTILLRGNAANGASGGAFVGDWSGVTFLTAQVIHDAPAPVNFFVRIATPGNFPAHVGIVPVPVLPNTWTEISVAIDPSNPLLIAEGGTFAGTFGNVGNVQIGASVPLAFEGVPFTFGFDQVAIVPEPATAGLLALGLVALAVRRRSGS